MKLFPRFGCLAAVLMAGLGVPFSGQAATSMLPFETPGTTWAERPELVGKVIDRRIDEFSFNEVAGRAIKGSVESLVVKEAASGTLDFYWRVSVAPDSYWGIARLAGVGGLGSANDTVGWLSEGFGTIGGRSPIGFANNEFDFGFDLPGRDIGPGMQSQYVFLRTNATRYDLGGTFGLRTDMQRIPLYQEQRDSPYYTTFSPVPEPELCAMMAMAFAFAVVATRRRLARRSAAANAATG